MLLGIIMVAKLLIQPFECAGDFQDFEFCGGEFEGGADVCEGFCFDGEDDCVFCFGFEGVDELGGGFGPAEDSDVVEDCFFYF